jgi:4-amino-4-deoxy-L-arabinose transferase-like glycosyltransferase
MKFDQNHLWITLIASVFFIPFIGDAHLFDWDEINFAECSREMLLTGDYLLPQINFAPFWEKPPLFIWLQTLSMHIFGINEFAARLPNALCGIFTLNIIYFLGKKLYDITLGWWWVLAYIGSFLPHLYFKSGIIDPWFNLFIFLALVFLFKNKDVAQPSKSSKLLEGSGENSSVFTTSLILAGTCAGLAVLTKGPAGFLIITLTWFIKNMLYPSVAADLFAAPHHAANKFAATFTFLKQYIVFSLITVSVASLWFGLITLKNGFWFLNTFIEYNIRLAKTEDAGHGGFVGYHFVVLFFGCFPASIFTVQSLFKKYNFMGEKVDFTRLMKVLFWVVLILFSFVQSKIVHYSSMCYLPLTFLAALTLKRYVEEKRISGFTKFALPIIGILLGFIVAILPIIGQNIDLIKPLFQKDIFALKNLDASISWENWQIVVGISYILALIYTFFLLKNIKILRGGIVLFTATALFLNIALIVFVNKIEGYSQNAAITFFEEHAQEDCYILTYDYKSYAHFFYAKKRQINNPQHIDNQWLISGNVDKPTYIVGKYASKKELDTVPQLQYLYERNGFVFYRRK